MAPAPALLIPFDGGRRLPGDMNRLSPLVVTRFVFHIDSGHILQAMGGGIVSWQLPARVKDFDLLICGGWLVIPGGWNAVKKRRDGLLSGVSLEKSTYKATLFCFCLVGCLPILLPKRRCRFSSLDMWRDSPSSVSRCPGASLSTRHGVTALVAGIPRSWLGKNFDWIHGGSERF